MPAKQEIRRGFLDAAVESNGLTRRQAAAVMHESARLRAARTRALRDEEQRIALDFGFLTEGAEEAATRLQEEPPPVGWSSTLTPERRFRLDKKWLPELIGTGLWTALMVGSYFLHMENSMAGKLLTGFGVCFNVLIGVLLSVLPPTQGAIAWVSRAARMLVFSVWAVSFCVLLFVNLDLPPMRTCSFLVLMSSGLLVGMAIWETFSSRFQYLRLVAERDMMRKGTELAARAGTGELSGPGREAEWKEALRPFLDAVAVAAKHDPVARFRALISARQRERQRARKYACIEYFEPEPNDETFRCIAYGYPTAPVAVQRYFEEVHEKQRPARFNEAWFREAHEETKGSKDPIDAFRSRPGHGKMVSLIGAAFHYRRTFFTKAPDKCRTTNSEHLDINQHSLEDVQDWTLLESEVACPVPPGLDGERGAPCGVLLLSRVLQDSITDDDVPLLAKASRALWHAALLRKMAAEKQEPDLGDGSAAPQGTTGSS